VKRELDSICLSARSWTLINACRTKLIESVALHWYLIALFKNALLGEKYGVENWHSPKDVLAEVELRPEDVDTVFI